MELNTITLVQEKAPTFTRLAEVLPLTTQAEIEQASAVLRHVKTLIKALEKERKALVGPLKEQTKEIDARYRAPRRALEEIETKIKRRVGEAHLRAEEARTLALEAASELAQAGDQDGAREAITTASAPPASAPGVSVRYKWSAMLTDASVVPREYLTVDAAKLAKVAQDHGTGPVPPPAVPGIEWVRRPIVSARGMR